jgi:chemotaxis methyl-accepting protein methylase
MLLGQIAGFEDYARLLADKPAEALALSDDIMIGVTAFFRDGANVEGLSEFVFPRIPLASDDPVRIWVPGCATGEEAYSIAICLSEYLEQHNGNDAFQIFATDTNNRAVERARNGTYSSAIARDVSAERLRRFFIQVPGGYQISRQIRERCTLAKHNLVTDPPFSRLDLVSCHNVLIYLRPEIQERVLATFYEALKPGGFLAVARSENGGEQFSPIGSLNTASLPSEQGLFAPVAPPRPEVRALRRRHRPVRRIRPCRRSRIARSGSSNGRCWNNIRHPRCWWMKTWRFCNSVAAPVSSLNRRPVKQLST